MRYRALLLICILLGPVPVLAEDRLIITEAKKEVVIAGYTRNVKSRAVSSEISGKVLNVNYDVGQTIRNKPFIEMDPTFIHYQIESTVSSLAKTEIGKRKAVSKISYLEKESLRIENLYKGDLATEAKKDAVFQELDQARLELEAIEKEQSVLQTTLRELRERRNRHSIYAPKGWVVTHRDVEEGEVIQPGVRLATVSDYSKLVVPLSVSTEELSAVESFPDEFDAMLEGEPVKVSVNWVNPEFDEKTRKLKIELIIEKYRGTKRGGLKLTLPLRIPTEGLFIPKAAVVDRYENPRVRLKQTEEVVQLLVIGESEDSLLVGEDERLVPGTELLSAEE